VMSMPSLVLCIVCALSRLCQGTDMARRKRSLGDVQYQARHGVEFRKLRDLLREHGTHVCWLCGNGIDMSLPHTAEISWTVDHVQSVKSNPELITDPTNLREAHRKCNSVKGARNSAVRPVASKLW